MPGVSRDNDKAEGDLIPSQTTVFANNEEVIVDGDDVAAHPPGGVHAGPPLPTVPASINPNVYVENELAIVQGDPATCLHVTTGSNNVYIYDLAARAAQALGLPQLLIDQEEAGEILEDRDYERAAGIDPDTLESAEYGDGGVATQPGGETNRFNNTSPVTGETGPVDTAAVATTTPSTQPSNENGQYIQWLPHVDSRVKPEVVRKLEALSQAVGYQLVITSGYRSPEYNERVGGAKLSQHQEGNAVDVVQSGLTLPQRQQFIQAAIDVGFTGIGVYNTFCHVDIGGRRAWGSPSSRRHLYKYPWAQEVLGANGYATS